MPGATQGAKNTLRDVKLPRATWVSPGFSRSKPLFPDVVSLGWHLQVLPCTQTVAAQFPDTIFGWLPHSTACKQHDVVPVLSMTHFSIWFWFCDSSSFFRKVFITKFSDLGHWAHHPKQCSRLPVILWTTVQLSWRIEINLKSNHYCSRCFKSWCKIVNIPSAWLLKISIWTQYVQDILHIVVLTYTEVWQKWQSSFNMPARKGLFNGAAGGTSSSGVYFLKVKRWLKNRQIHAVCFLKVEHRITNKQNHVVCFL